MPIMVKVDNIVPEPSTFAISPHNLCSQLFCTSLYDWARGRFRCLGAQLVFEGGSHNKVSVVCFRVSRFGFRIGFRAEFDAWERSLCSREAATPRCSSFSSRIACRPAHHFSRIGFGRLFENYDTCLFFSQQRDHPTRSLRSF